MTERSDEAQELIGTGLNRFYARKNETIPTDMKVPMMA